MDFTDIPDNNNADEHWEARPGCFKTVLKTLLLPLLFALILLLITPLLLSTDSGRVLALEKINQSIAPARLSVGEWSLGWLSHVKAGSITYDDPGIGVAFKSETISFERGLLGLLPLGRLNLGMVTCGQPLLELALEPPPITLPAEDRAPKVREKGGDLFLPIVDLVVGANIERGRMEIVSRNQERMVVSQINGRALMNSWRKPIQVDLRMAIGGGHTKLDGHIQSIRDFIKKRDAGTRTEQLTIRVSDVDLAAVRPLLRHWLPTPSIGGGVAEGLITISQSGKAHFAADIGLLINGFFLEESHHKRSPTADLGLMADVAVSSDDIDVRRFEFASPWLKSEAHGRLHRRSGEKGLLGSLNARTTANLPVIARDFGTTMGILPNCTIKKGEVLLSGTIEGREEACAVDIKANVSGLEVVTDNETINLQPAPSLELQALLPYNALPLIQNAHFKAPFADLFCKGRIEEATLKAQLDLTRFSKDFRRIIKSCPPMVGTLYLDMATTLASERIRVTSFAKLNELAVMAGNGGMAVLPQGSLKLDGYIPLRKGKPAKEVNECEFSFTLDKGKGTGSWKRLALPQQENQTLLRGFSLQSDLDTPSTLRFLGWSLPPEIRRHLAFWQGRLLANISAEMAGGILKAKANTAGVRLVHNTKSGEWSLPDFKLEGSLHNDGNRGETKLELTSTSGIAYNSDGVALFIEPEVKGSLEVSVPAGGNHLRIPMARVNSKLLDLEMKAEFSEVATRCIIDARGSLALDFDQISKLLHMQAMDEFTLKGRRARNFKFNAPLAGGWGTLLSDGALDCALFLETLDGMGVRTGPADIKLSLAQGALKVDYAPVLNGGRLQLKPLAYVGVHGMTLEFPENTKLLSNVRIEQSTIDMLLGKITPLFQGSKIRTGTLSAELARFEYFPEMTPQKCLNTDLRVTLNKLEMEVGPTLTEVLSYLRIKEKRYQVDSLPIRLIVRDGRVNMEPVRMVIDQQPVILSGWVDFDNNIKYLIEIPVTDKLVGKHAGKLFNNVTIKIPVAGTVDQPRLDTSALKEMMANLLKNSIAPQTVDKVSDFLKKLQNELKR